MSEIAIYQPPQGDLIPASASPRGELDDWITVADQIVRFAEVICRSTFVPEGLRGSVPNTAAAMLTGRELGIPPMTSLANIHVIHGKPGLSALVMRALVMRQGHDWEEVEANNARVVLRGRKKGSSTWTTASFSTADAQIAKLALGNYPQDKLYARASARLARRAFSDIIAGMPYSAEELEDGFTDDGVPAEVASGPAPAAIAAPAPAAAPRTAQRRTRTPAPAQPATPAALAVQASADTGLPPLPGEDDPDPTPVPTAGTSDASTASTGRDEPDSTDYDTPGTVNNRQLTAIWTVLTKEFNFGNTDAEKEVARMACAVIIGRDLASTTNLSHNDARTILDTLGHVKHQAQEGGGDPRNYLTDLLRRTEEARAEAGNGQ